MQPPARLRHARALLVLTALLATRLPAPAAPPDGTDPAEAPKIQFRIMSLHRIISGLCYIKDGEPVPFIISHSRPTPWMEFQSHGPLNLYRTEDVEAWTEDQPPPRPVAQFTPSGSGTWLFLILPENSPDFPFPYRILPVRDQETDAKEGIRFFNFTPSEIAVAVSDKLLRLRPGEVNQTQPSPGPDFAIDLKILTNQDSTWQEVSSTVFGQRPGARINILVFPDKDQIRLKRFVDTLSP